MRTATASAPGQPWNGARSAPSTRSSGDVVAVDLKRDDGRWLYKLRILSPDGRRRDVKIDAGSLKVIDDDDDD
jgi:uncharacterized membrane protein YkoI